MCGIAGYIGYNTIDQSRISQTLDLMKNRGPDNQDYVRIKNGNLNIILLNSRLSIIDLDKRSNQPFIKNEKFLTYNGEIYNYIELRKILEEKKCVFDTDSDTEVLFNAFEEFGINCVKHFEGMWAFSLYDKKKEMLYLSRDRFGEKPLYYAQLKDGVYFGSEIKFIKSLSNFKFQVYLKHLYRYLVNGYKSLYKTNETFYEKIKRIPPSSNVSINKELKIKINRFWHPSFHPKNLSLEDCIYQFKSALLNSVKLRLRSDVPLAFCLSGGIDSASLVSIAAKEFDYDVATYSIVDTDERYDESENINAIVDDIGCKNTQIYIPKKGFFERLEGLINYHDQPISTISYYVHSFLSESISKDNYKVAISGTAADELVTGYYDHYNMYLYEMRKTKEYNQYLKEWKQSFGQIVRNPYLKNPELYFNNPYFRDHIYLNRDKFLSYIKDDFSEDFFEEKYTNALLRNRMLNELFHETIPIILQEDDLNSMLFSIENRSPYLDQNLFNLSYSIPTKHLIQKGFAKFILREAMKDILNEKVRTDRKKVGFNASVNSLIDLEDEKVKRLILKDSEIFHFVDKYGIEKLLRKKPMPNSFSKFLFNFLNAKIFMDNEYIIN